MQWKKAADIQAKVNALIEKLNFDHIKAPRVFCYRGYGSQAKAYARIWSLPRVWQQALNQAPSYVIEVIAEKFDCLPSTRQIEVLIHELLHIPQTFSGALRPHRLRYFRLDQRKVKSLMQTIKDL